MTKTETKGSLMTDEDRLKKSVIAMRLGLFGKLAERFRIKPPETPADILAFAEALNAIEAQTDLPTFSNPTAN